MTVHETVEIPHGASSSFFRDQPISLPYLIFSGDKVRFAASTTIFRSTSLARLEPTFPLNGVVLAKHGASCYTYA